jgi:hypothetical protein
MGKRKGKGTRHSGAMVASSQAREWLRQDLPTEVKTQVLLAVRGGRQQRRRCLACNAQGIFVEVYVPYEAVRVGGDAGRGIRIYWSCTKCHEIGLTPELEAKLKEHCR